MKNFALLKKESPFYPIFENGMCPIKNILVPSRVQIVAFGETECFWVDISKLSAEQIDRIADIVVAQCNAGTREDFLFHIAQGGELPLRAIHVQSLITNSLAFL